MIKNILFDFDGVILDSMTIRDKGFEEIIGRYDMSKVQEFIKYHRFNGGLSRFHKFRYFFEEMLKKEVTDEKVQALADEFSQIMRRELVNKKYLIKDTLDFIIKNNKKYTFFIVSGSEQNELRFLCSELGISHYFKKILGSPIHKNELVKNLIIDEKLSTKESILIGDSINDYEAAMINSIDFYGYNNEKLKVKSKEYIYNFNILKLN